MTPLDYEEACRALGYNYRVPTTENGERWLTEVVNELIDKKGPEATLGPEGDNIRQIFGGNLGPRPTQKGPPPKKG